MSRIVGLGFTLALLWWGQPAYAAPIIFDNGIPNLDTAVGSETFGSQVAESFNLVPGLTTLAGINWWGVYGNAATPSLTDDFTFRLFNDAAGEPDLAPFLELHLGDVGRTATGDSLSGFPQFEVFEYSASISPVALAPGVTYWIMVLNDTTVDPDDNWFWATSSFLGTHAFRQGEGIPWSPTGPDLAFNLAGVETTIPEPATFVLIGMGAAGLLAKARGRRKRNAENI